MLPVRLGWAAGMEILVASCEICLSLPNTRFPAVPPGSAGCSQHSGCLHLLSWLGRKEPVPQGAVLVLGHCPCMWT